MVTFTDDTVDGNVQRVLQIESDNPLPPTLPTTSGVRTQTSGVLNPANFSIVLLANFLVDPVNLVSTKIFDFKNLSVDAGLYVNSSTGVLTFINNSGVIQGTSPAGLTLTDYSQIALTRDDATDTVNVYSTDVMGATSPAFSFIDTNGLAILGDGTPMSDAFLTLYKDDAQGAGGALVAESTQGNIARLRLYDGVLSAATVAGLDRVAIPEPSSATLLLAGAAVVGGSVRRRVRS